MIDFMIMLILWLFLMSALAIALILTGILCVIFSDKEKYGKEF